MKSTQSECIIQIPSEQHIIHTKGMYAGKDEDQYQRLSHMVEVVKQFQKEHPTLPVRTSNEAALSPDWLELLQAIQQTDELKALHLFQRIPAKDILLQSMLAVHSYAYLQKIIRASIFAQKEKALVQIGPDTTITAKTFEILIYDIATTLNHEAQVYISFGLPTHHAYSEAGTGFCVFNKSVILLKHAELAHSKPLQYFIAGTDVNRDNGICAILMNSSSYMDICHVDIFDSRVYPGQDFAYINKESGIKGTIADDKIGCWQKEQLNYYAIDLSLTIRKDNNIHPAIAFSIKKMNESIQSAKKTGQKVWIMLPTGWDSHKDETAPCGKCVRGVMMSAEESAKTRFNNEDLNYFYEHIFSLYIHHKESIAGLYWGLEGGYDRSMYKQQVQLLLHNLTKYILNEDLEPQSPTMRC